MTLTPSEFEALKHEESAADRWAELLRLLRSIDSKLDKVIDAEHQGLETVGVEPRMYIQDDTRTMDEIIDDAGRENLRTGPWSTTGKDGI